MDHHFWQDKRVFITGHSGFKGSWLSLWLHQLGADVYGYSLPTPHTPNLFQSAHIDDCVKSTFGDIRDLAFLTETLNHVQPDIVFHLAGQSLMQEAYIHPISTLETNIMGTAHILEAVRDTPSVKAVVLVTSDKCYENRDWLWGYREDDPMGGKDPYSASKGAAELVIAAYRRSFFEQMGDNATAIASVRNGNVIGGGDFAHDRLLPDFIRAVEKEQSLIVRHPHATRPWQFILEPLYGYLSLAERLYDDGQDYAEGWNFGPADNDTQSVSQICVTFNHFLHKNGIPPIDVELKPQPNDLHVQQLLRLDTSKARQRLDWLPKLDLFSALELTAEWYANYLHHDNVRTICENQIDLYQHLG